MQAATTTGRPMNSASDTFLNLLINIVVIVATLAVTLGLAWKLHRRRRRRERREAAREAQRKFNEWRAGTLQNEKSGASAEGP